MGVKKKKNEKSIFTFCIRLAGVDGCGEGDVEKSQHTTALKE